MPTFSTVTLPDGARLAYEVLGSEWQGQRQPIVLIGGVSSLRGDWDRLAASLALQRPVLIYDHRGMGDSKYSTQNKDDPISIESLARDLLFLLQSLHWKEISICGFSMGGAVTQQLLFLPYLLLNPTPLPFTITHVFLSGTFPEMWKEKGYGLKFDFSPLPGPGPLTEEQKKARAKPVTESTFDAAWLADPKNQERFEWWLERMIRGRPIQTILKQGRAVRDMNFTGLHSKLSKDIQFLVIHGERDAVVPFSSGQKLLQLIPWARFVEVGYTPGQIPNLAFGHFWFEYFDVRVWTDVIEKFGEIGLYHIVVMGLTNSTCIHGAVTSSSNRRQYTCSQFEMVLSDNPGNRLTSVRVVTAECNTTGGCPRCNNTTLGQYHLVFGISQIPAVFSGS